MNSELVQCIKNVASDAVNQVHTAFPGVIESYDPGKGQATVKPTMRMKTKGGNYKDYPKISGVPVMFQQHSAQTATIAFPVKPGDGCLIIVSEQSLDQWMYGQETGTDLRFDLSNAVCIPGLFNPANDVVSEAISQDAIIADIGGTRITIKRDKNIIMDGTKVTINADVEINGDLKVSGTASAAAHV